MRPISRPWVGASYAVVGGGGLLIGATSGLVTAMLNIDDSKYAKSINQNLAKVSESYDLQGDLHAQLEAMIPPEYIRDRQSADVLVSPVLSQIEVEHPSEKTMYLHIVGNLIFSWGENDDEGYVGSAQFEYDSAPARVKDWSSEDGQMYAEYILAGVNDIAQQMTERIVLRIENGPQILEIRETD